MRQRPLIGLITLTGIALLAVISTVPVVFGQPGTQIDDPTAWQQTVDASVSDLFTQTAEAPLRFAMTQTVAAAFQVAQTGTAQALVMPSETPTLPPTNAALPPVPTDTPAPDVPPTEAPPPDTRPDVFPTDVVTEIPIAEQVFENGRMFWLRPTLQIWVMQASPDDPNSGDWFCYNDTFVDGEMETDPEIVSPSADLIQPRRGFGKVWRDMPGVRDALGWAVTPEFELNSTYTYVAGGTVDDNGQYVPGPGEHRLTTLYGDTISFFESDIRGDCLGGTWRLKP